MKIHDKYCIFNINLGDWEVICVLPRYLGCLTRCMHSSAQILSSAPDLVHSLRYSAWTSGVRLRVGANLGHVAVIPGVDVGLEAAVAVAALGPFWDEAILLLRYHNLGLLRSGANMEPDHRI